MSTEKNGKGTIALGILLSLLLAGANLLGAHVLMGVREQAIQLNALTLQVRLLSMQLDSMAKERWTVAQQVQFAADLAMLNQTLRSPDVRRIAREVQ
jgi:outer membrane murein-binding lipoprotein Lpp